MCGGKGVRIKTHSHKIEKPLIMLKNRPLIDYIINSILKTKMNLQIYAAVSPNTKNTRQYLKDNFAKITLLETSGTEYSKDYLDILNFFINNNFKDKVIDEGRILFLPIDIPLISPKILKEIIKMEQKKPCLVIIVEKKYFKLRNISLPYEIKLNDRVYAYSGISIIDISKIKQKHYEQNTLIEEEYRILDNFEISININTIKDLENTEKLLENYNRC